MKLCLTIWSVDLVPLWFCRLLREGCGADLVSRPSFSSKEAPEEGKGGYSLVSVAQLLLGVSVMLTEFCPC